MSRISELVRRRLLGLAFIVLLAGLLALSIGAYQKVFGSVVWVTLTADHTGLQLDPHADVKLRGVLVGEVRDISADGQQARLRLAIDADQAPHIPSNVRGVMLPKTLFGEKYVELMPPAEASAQPIQDGDRISQDRSTSTVELEKVLDRALPVLKAIQPDQLSDTLTALSAALQGRGERIGNTVVTLDSYLGQLNQQMPTIQSDVEKLADVLDIYNGALPDLLTILRNVTVTSNTVAEQQTNLAALLADTTDLADTATPFLLRHGDRIIQLGQVTQPVLSVLAEYAPEFPCLTAGLVQGGKLIEGAFDTGRLHITLEITRDNGKYLPGDEPVNGADNGPNCRGLPSPQVPWPAYQINDGYQYGAPHGGPLSALPQVPIVGAGQSGTTGTGETAGSKESGKTGGKRSQGRAVTGDLLAAAMGFAGTSEEKHLVTPLVAAATGQNVDQIGDISDLLWGPLMRGAVVSAV